MQRTSLLAKSRVDKQVHLPSTCCLLFFHIQTEIVAYSQKCLQFLLRRATTKRDSVASLGLKSWLAMAGTPPMEPPLLRLRWRDASYAQTSQQHAEYE